MGRAAPEPRRPSFPALAGSLDQAGKIGRNVGNAIGRQLRSVERRGAGSAQEALRHADLTGCRKWHATHCPGETS